MNTNKPIIQQDPADWRTGYDAAADGLPQYPIPPGITDSLSYVSGWIEGHAALKQVCKDVAKHFQGRISAAQVQEMLSTPKARDILSAMAQKHAGGDDPLPPTHLSDTDKSRWPLRKKCY